MKKIFLLLGISVSLHSARAVEHLDLYVAPDGSDLNRGTVQSAFATMPRAMQEIRRLKSSGEYPEKGVTVWFRRGEYHLSESVRMTAADSGLPGAPVIYQAFPGERVVFSGALKLDNKFVQPARATDILNRIIDQDAAQKILQIDLTSAGIGDFGSNQTRGTGMPSPSREARPPDFLIDGKRLELARWPNPGEYVQMDEVIDPGVDWQGRSGRGESDASSGKFVKDEPRGGTFRYSFTRPDLWNDDHVFVSGVLSETWVWSHVKVTINKPQRQITLSTPIAYGLIKNEGRRHFFHFEDIPEEIDQPGEYWLNRKTGILYFLPPPGYQADSEIRISMLKTPMIMAQDSSWVTFSNLLFEGSRDICMEISGGERVRVEHCEIRNFLMAAINIRGGKDHGVFQSHIHGIGSNVMALTGGDWATLTPSGFEISNNHIHDFGYYIPSSNCAVSLSGVGTRITHNLIHDAPHQVIRFSGNDHVIMYNEIHDAVRDFFDAGAINCHLGNDPTQRGTLISSNYLHEIGMKMEGCKAIYIDGASFGVTIEKNIFQNIGTQEVQNNAININTGSHIRVGNNIFLNCTVALKNYFYLSQANSLRFNMYRDHWKELFAKYDFSRMPHGKKYPELLHFWDEEHELPTTNSFVNNVIYNPAVGLLNGAYLITVHNRGIPIEKLVDTSGTMVFPADPGFVDFAAGDLNLKPGAQVFKMIPGFEEVPFRMMGLSSPVGPVGLMSGGN